MSEVLCDVFIYMKSGSVIRVNNCTKFDFKREGADVCEAVWKQKLEENERLLHIDPTQIEAVTYISKDE